MAKCGMKQYVHKHKDPTFDIVLGKFRKEARKAAEQKRSMASLSCAGYGQKDNQYRRVQAGIRLSHRRQENRKPLWEVLIWRNLNSL